MKTHETHRPVTARPGFGARVAARFLAHIRAQSLDEALAHGADPADRALLEVRAAWLVSPTRRAQVADAWSSTLDQARGTGAVVDPRIPVARSSVLDAEPDILRLADLLRGPTPVAAGTIARVRALLSDGTGPLYTGDGLHQHVAELVAEIDPSYMYDGSTGFSR